MRTTFRRILSLITCIAALLLGMSTSPAGADEASSTTTPMCDLSDMVVDGPNRHVFLSQGWIRCFENPPAPGETVEVMNFDGTPVGSINAPFASGMAIGGPNVYATLPDVGKIAIIDRTTVERAGALSVSPYLTPRALEFAGGKLWFSHDCGSGEASGGIGWVNTDGTGLGNAPSSTDIPSCPNDLVADPADPESLYAFRSSEGSTDAHTLYRYDISSGEPALVLKRSFAHPIADIAVSPGGQTVAVAQDFATGQDRFVEVASEDFTQTGRSFPTANGPPRAAAYDPTGGFLAVGQRHSVYQQRDPQVLVYSTGTGALHSSLNLTKACRGGHSLLGRDIRFSPNGRSLFALVEGTPDARFAVANDPTKSGTTIDVSAPMDVLPNDHIQLNGALAFGDIASSGGIELDVYRADGIGPAVHVGTAVTKADGDFVFADANAPLPPEPYGSISVCYDVRYPGDPAHRATSTNPLWVEIEKGTPGVSMSPDRDTVGPGMPITLSGKLTLSGSDSLEGRTIQIMMDRPGGEADLELGTAMTDPQGRYTFLTNAPSVKDVYRYRGVWSGNARYYPAGSSFGDANVWVTELTSHVTISTPDEFRGL
jgi:hypothetical protein